MAPAVAPEPAHATNTKVRSGRPGSRPSNRGGILETSLDEAALHHRRNSMSLEERKVEALEAVATQLALLRGDLTDFGTALRSSRRTRSR
jgi:hypothetical protein